MTRGGGCVEPKCVYTSNHKPNEREIKMATKQEALNYLKGHASFNYWNVACMCKACRGKAFVKLSLEDMAKRMVASGLDFTNPASLKKLSHQIVSA